MATWVEDKGPGGRACRGPGQSGVGGAVSLSNGAHYGRGTSGRHPITHRATHDGNRNSRVNSA